MLLVVPLAVLIVSLVLPVVLVVLVLLVLLVVLGAACGSVRTVAKIFCANPKILTRRSHFMKQVPHVS